MKNKNKTTKSPEQFIELLHECKESADTLEETMRTMSCGALFQVKNGIAVVSTGTAWGNWESESFMGLADFLTDGDESDGVPIRKRIQVWIKELRQAAEMLEKELENINE